MKTKAALLFGASLLAGTVLAQAGPRIGISIGNRVSCAPVPICAPVVYRAYPVSAACAQPAFYSWGPSVIVYSAGPSSAFTNISPVMNYGVNTPIYRVPAPIASAQPVTVYPTSNFGWKR